MVTVMDMATAMVVITHTTVVTAMVIMDITARAIATVTTESTITIAAVTKAPLLIRRKLQPQLQQPLQPQPILLQPILQPQTQQLQVSPINLQDQEEVVVEASSFGKPLAVKARVSLLRMIIIPVLVQQTIMNLHQSLRNPQKTKFCSTAAMAVVEASEALLLLPAVVVVADLVEVVTLTIDL